MEIKVKAPNLGKWEKGFGVHWRNKVAVGNRLFTIRDRELLTQVLNLSDGMANLCKKASHDMIPDVALARHSSEHTIVNLNTWFLGGDGGTEIKINTEKLLETIPPALKRFGPDIIEIFQTGIEGKWTKPGSFKEAKAAVLEKIEINFSDFLIRFLDEKITDAERVELAGGKTGPKYSFVAYTFKK